jgi:predicted RNase H-like nuclease
MVRVAGVDGAPGGWAVVLDESGRRSVQKVESLRELFDGVAVFDLIAIDIPIGLLDKFETGGRHCDREARTLLGVRGSSVFPAPVRSVLGAASYADACERSRKSAPNGKAISKQTFAISDKIAEVDHLLRTQTGVRKIVREVHPEICFFEMTGSPMRHSKRKQTGRDDRKQALRERFHDTDALLEQGRRRGLPEGDVLDAAVACWSALRQAEGKGRSLIAPIPRDSCGLPMTIWV